MNYTSCCDGQKVTIVFTDNNNYFKGLQVFSPVKVELRKKCISFFNYQTAVNNYIYVNDVKVEIGFIDDEKHIGYVYQVIDYYYSVNYMSKKTFGKITEIIGVKASCGFVSKTSNAQIKAKNKQIITKAWEDCDDENNLICFPLEQLIISKLETASKLKINSVILKRIPGLSIEQLLSFLKYYHFLVKGEQPEFEYYICHTANHRYYKRVSGSQKIKLSNRNACIKLNISQVKLCFKYKLNPQFVDANLENIILQDKNNNYDYIKKVEVICEYLSKSFRHTNDICSKFGIRRDVNELMSNLRINQQQWSYLLKEAKSYQLVSLALLLYSKRLFGNDKYLLFAQCQGQMVTNENIVNLGLKITVLRNKYAHLNNTSINSSQALHELVTELYYWVFLNSFGVTESLVVTTSCLLPSEYVVSNSNYDVQYQVAPTIIDSGSCKRDYATIRYRMRNQTKYQTVSFDFKSSVRTWNYYAQVYKKLFAHLNISNTSYDEIKVNDECNLNKLGNRLVAKDCEGRFYQGVSDFTLSTKQLNYYNQLLGDNIIYRIKLYNLYKIKYDDINLSLVPQISSLIRLKTVLRFDIYIAELNILIQGINSSDEMLINMVKLDIKNKSKLKYFRLSENLVGYLKNFSDIYEYCQLVHLLPPDLVDKLLDNSSKPLTTSSNIIDQIDVWTSIISWKRSYKQEKN